MPLENIKLKFDTELFTNNFKKLERKLGKIDSEYVTCVDTVYDNLQDSGTVK